NYCISFGLPDGTFTTQSCYSVSGTLTGVLLADYDSDGILDLINPGSTMSVRPGLGGGLFGAITNHYLGGGHNPRSVFWDFDGDGLTDLVRLFDTSSSTSLLNIYKGSGPGAFTNHQDLPFDFRPERISRADFTGNGHQDILLVGANRPLLLAKNNGSGDFSFAPTNAIARTTSVSQPAIADFNGDGLSDVALTYYYSAKSADVFVNTGAGFSPPITNAVGDLAGSIIAGDFDRDGRVDLVVASYSPAKFHYLRNVTHPSLRIDRHKPFLEVSWPAWKGFDLYISTNLTTGSWNLQNSYIFETGNRNRFSFNPIQQQVFFKLVERSE
ncbi:MAG: FG-GAP repeat domain-containing protein, partial [Limisphaerales bacterium]